MATSDEDDRTGERAADEGGEALLLRGVRGLRQDQALISIRTTARAAMELMAKAAP